MKNIWLFSLLLICCPAANAQVVRSSIKDDGTMDLNDAIHALAGTFDGDAEPAMARVNPTTVYFYDVQVKVDFDKNTAELTAEYYDKQSGPVKAHLAGTLNDEGIFYLHPRSDATAMRDDVIAAMHCGEVMCTTLVIDIGAHFPSGWGETQYRMSLQ